MKTHNGWGIAYWVITDVQNCLITPLLSVHDYSVLLLLLMDCSVTKCHGGDFFQEPLEEKFPTAAPQAMSFMQVSVTPTAKINQK